MRFGHLAFGSLAAMAVVTSAAADDRWRGAAAARKEIFWNPADTFWAAGADGEICARGGVRKVSASEALPRLRTALYERRGQLVGEIRSPPSLFSTVVAQARSCANEAGSAATIGGLLKPTPASWSTFHAAFSTCMVRNHAAQYVGSMTLWVDQRCVW